MCMAWEKIHSSPSSRSVLVVGTVHWVSVVGQHVVVHVDGGAVVDGVTQALSEDGLAGVRGEAEQEEAGLRRGEAVYRLKENKRETIYIVGTLICFTL